MKFIIFNAILLFAGFPFVFLLGLGVMAMAAPLVLVQRSKSASIIVGVPMMTLFVVFQIYLFGFWGAFCAALTQKFIAYPEVTWTWLYYGLGFTWAVSLVGWLAAKERQANPDSASGQGLGVGMYWLLVAATYVVFAIRPDWLLFAYGWALRIIPGNIV